MTALFPTRKLEAWRYADIDALAPVWEQLAEPLTLTVGPGESFEQMWLPSGDDVQVRRDARSRLRRARRRACSCSTRRAITAASNLT